MANYAKINNGQIDVYPYSIGELRRANPNTSFPDSISDEILTEYGVVVIVDHPAPSYDRETQKVEQATVPVLENGSWVIGWSIVNFTADELAEKVADLKTQQQTKRQAAYYTEADPLFFMSQRGEATVEEWQAKVAEIKARFPYPAA